MKALSIKQPWAWLICKGIKDVENRTWHIHMPPLLNYPAIPRRIYVHTGNQIDNRAWLFIEGRIDEDIRYELKELIWRNSLPRGAIIGEVDIIGCTDKSDSPWFTGPYALMLAGGILYDDPIPCKGQLGFFEPAIPR
jgi:hypothetical protein